MGQQPIRRHAKAKHYLLNVVQSLFESGVNKSKHVIFQLNYESQRKRTSEAIHSFSTATTYKKVVANFADFLKQEYGIKYEQDFKKLSTEQLFTYVDRYFEKEKQKGVSKKTLQKHISALYKTLGAIDHKIREYFNADNRIRWRDGLEKQDCDRYNNPDRIVENLRKINKTAYTVTMLQRLTGARIGDVKKIKIDEENMKIIVEKSKGGRSRSVYFDYFKEDFEKVKHYKEVLDEALREKSFSEIRKEYYDALRLACKKAGEPYHGSHAFRYEWAQNTYNVIKDLPREEQMSFYLRILQERNLSKDDIKQAFERVIEKDAFAEAIISEELGHSRLDISYEYLKLKGK
jgi:hypothetical protein